MNKVIIANTYDDKQLMFNSNVELIEVIGVDNVRAWSVDSDTIDINYLNNMINKDQSFFGNLSRVDFEELEEKLDEIVGAQGEEFGDTYLDTDDYTLVYNHQYGIFEEVEDKHFDYKYEYWDGSNHQFVILEDWDYLEYKYSVSIDIWNPNLGWQSPIFDCDSASLYIADGTYYVEKIWSNYPNEYYTLDNQDELLDFLIDFEIECWEEIIENI